LNKRKNALKNRTFEFMENLSQSLEYNTVRPKMHIPEYGRNVQKMVDHAVGLATKEERNKVANAIIKVMGELNPQLRGCGRIQTKIVDASFYHV
jgi:hypothetical protein